MARGGSGSGSTSKVKAEYDEFDLAQVRDGRERANTLVELIWAQVRELVGIRRREQRISGEPYGSDFADDLPDAVTFEEKFAGDASAAVLRDILKEGA